jgi:hypothetical protein
MLPQYFVCYALKLPFNRRKHGSTTIRAVVPSCRGRVLPQGALSKIERTTSSLPRLPRASYHEPHRNPRHPRTSSVSPPPPLPPRTRMGFTRRLRGRLLHNLYSQSVTLGQKNTPCLVPRNAATLQRCNAYRTHLSLPERPVLPPAHPTHHPSTSDVPACLPVH